MIVAKILEKCPDITEIATPAQVLWCCSVAEKQGVENIVSIGAGFGGVLFVEANGMFIGIEKDGYAHT